MAGRRNKLKARKALAAAVAVLAALSVSAPAAQAAHEPFEAAATTVANPCPDQTLTQPFLPWGDAANYVALPNGGFESGPAGWRLSGGARVIEGNEPLFANAPTDRYSLLLPAGSSATSSFMCVGLDYPTMRFFARSGGLLPGALEVDMLIRYPDGKLKVKGIGIVRGSEAWQPTRVLWILRLLEKTLEPGETTSVAFRFQPKGLVGRWQIDDVYVDPFVSR